MFGLSGNSTYSFLDLTGSIFYPKTGAFLFSGSGIGQVSIRPNPNETLHEYGVDGTVLLSKIPVTGGKINIKCQQISSMNSWLLWTYSVMSVIGGAADWGRMVMFIRDVQHGTQHNIRGLSFVGLPETNYADRGGMITWEFVYAAMLVFPPHPTGAGQLSAIASKLFG